MMATLRPRGAAGLSGWLARPAVLAVWCAVAAFGCYACMYGFRKPFTAAGYGDAAVKAWLVTAQVLGYTLSKVVGIRVIAEMPSTGRARALLALVGGAWVALLLFAVAPAPLDAAALFLNGLALGMVFGVVVGFVEGRALTELFVAGLCASFILADGASKSVGAWLLQSGIPERWMPVAAGALFAPGLVLFTWMLQQVPPPTARDERARAPRLPMTRAGRQALLRRHGVGILGVVAAYVLITVLRSVRADFAPEIWRGLGAVMAPALFTRSELWVALVVVVANGALVLVRDNRRAYRIGLALSVAGVLLALGALAGQRWGGLAPFPFMVLLGVGLYVPYVAVHTTIFERLIALTRERATMGFLMYLADAAGYVGYALVMVGRGLLPAGDAFTTFFLMAAAVLLGGALLALVAAGARRVAADDVVAVPA
jgi:hypothetical protein